MTTAWVLPGGVSLGAVQAGQASSLLAHGIEPDLLLGASAGSVNAAFLAADPTPRGAEALRQAWLGTSRRQVFPLSPTTAVLGLLGRRDHTVSNAALTRWLERQLPYRRIEEARLPLTVTATDLHAGQAVLLERGALIPALVASCALPGVFPPVVLDFGGRVVGDVVPGDRGLPPVTLGDEVPGHRGLVEGGMVPGHRGLVDGGMVPGHRGLVDGGMVPDAPIGRAVALGATRIYVLQTMSPHGAARPRGAAHLLLQAVGRTFAASRSREMAAWAERCDIYLVPAPTVATVSPFSFRGTAALISAAAELADTWLARARPLSLAPGDLRQVV